MSVSYNHVKPASDAFDIDRDRSIGYLLRDVSRRLLADLAARIEPHGVTIAQYFALRELWQNEGLTQRELGERIGTQESTTVSTIDAMESSDLLARQRSTVDRRKIHIYLTPRGRALRSKLLAHAATVVNDATANFSARDIEKFRALLMKISVNLHA